ncbi:MAG: ATP-binding protein [Muribaculaceae bacterium]|nr:ATP-binding protein [Muribaculaceae bacterium]
MIICIKIKNFYSLREETVLDFTADISSRRTSYELEENILECNGEKFVNLIGLFGGNAAGKSNIIKAIDFCRGLILHSHLFGSNAHLDFEPFKFQTAQPSEFYIDFIAEGVEYEYSFEISEGRILSENLFHYPNKRKARVFSREKTNLYSYGKGMISRPTEIEASTGPQTLFLSRGSSMNRSILQTVYRYFSDHVMTEISSFNLGNLSRTCFESNRSLLLKAFEVGDSDIIDIRWDESSTGKVKLLSYHQENPSIAFDFEKEESEGTKRLFFILMGLLNMNNNDCTVFLDEFDLKLHLLLAQFILDVVRASKGMQMVFTSHNPTLIDTSRLRPEQIVFVTKRKDGSSEFIPLSDYEGIEKIPDIMKAYLQGRFDGVPYIGNIKSLNFMSDNEGA